MRPGNYALNDLHQARWAAGSRRWENGLEHAPAHVLASVVSERINKPKPRGPAGQLARQGLLIDHGPTIVRLSEEHGVVEGHGVERLRVADRVRIRKNHVCPVVNPFPIMHLMRRDVVVALPVEGRAPFPRLGWSSERKGRTESAAAAGWRRPGRAGYRCPLLQSIALRRLASRYPLGIPVDPADG